MFHLLSHPEWNEGYRENYIIRYTQNDNGMNHKRIRKKQFEVIVIISISSIVYKIIIKFMLKVPFYTQTNYHDIITKTYEQNDKSNRYNLSDFFEILTESFVSNYASLDARQLTEYFQNKALNEAIPFGSTNKKLKEVIVAIKLLMPTLRACEYFLWNCKNGTHSGIDIIMPRWTPIPSFSDWVVTRIKQRDGIKKDEWNCVVVQTGDKYYSYKHMDKINVKYGDKIDKWNIIWLCWSTWQSTQYHLHFQVDAAISPFTPYRSNQLQSVIKNTLDPLPFLRNIFWYTKIFIDMPLSSEHKQSIESLFAAGIIKWNGNKISPDLNLPRRQAAIVFDRIAKKYNLYGNLPVINPMFSPYSDLDVSNNELVESLKWLQKYGIMVGNNWIFDPDRSMTGEEWIAVLGRLIFGLKNADNGMRYKNYVNFFENNKFIMKNWFYLGKSIIRKDAFLVLYRVLKSKGLIS